MTAQIQLGTLTLQPRRQLLADGRPLPIGGKALGILSVLAEAGGELVTKDELLGAVWPGLVVEENAIQVHVAALRKAMGAEAARLSTVRGLGYRLDVPEQTELPPPPARTQGPRPHSSVAVLPFANLTGDRAKDYLGDGIAQELITALSRATSLRMPSWISSFHYRGRGDLRTIGRELGVDTIVEGWVKGNAERLRVGAQLIDAETGFHIWADSFECGATELIAMEEELAGAIAAALSAQLAPLQAATLNHEAFDLFLQAHHKRSDPTPGSVERVLELLGRAVALDGRFARALSYLSFAQQLAFMTGLRAHAILAEARVNAERAVAADPGLWEGHSALAGIGLLTGDWKLAFDHSGAHDLCPIRGALLGSIGHIRAGVVQGEHTIALDPACIAAAGVCAVLHWIAGDDAPALRRAAWSITLGHPIDQMPIALIRAEAAFRAGEAALAAELLADGLPRPLIEAGLGDVVRRAYAAIAGKGGREMALAALDRFHRAPAVQPLLGIPPASGLLMSFYTRLGALDSAFRVGDELVDRWRAVGVIDQPSLLFLWTPEMAAFRRDPRFSELAERLGFAAQWRRHGMPDHKEWTEAAADARPGLAASA